MPFALPDIKCLKRRGRPSLAAAAAILLWLTVAWGAEKPGLQLEVVACGSEKVLLRAAVSAGTEFSIRFLHSYDRSPFEEHYRVLGPGHILLTHMTFKGSLNGQGFVLGTYRTRPDGSAELAAIHQDIERVTFRLGSPDLADHALLIHGRRLRLLDLAEAGTLLCIRVR